MLDNRFRIGRKVGAGAMATVFEGKDEKEGRTVAIKVLKPMLASDDTLKKRFEREYEVCCRLCHHNIIGVYGAGLVNGKLPYCVLEYLPYPTLEETVKERGPLSSIEVGNIMFCLAQALEHCHEQDVIHRDIKPANVIYCQDRRVVLVDFGLTLDTAALTKLTAAGKTLGTPPYMSPEQFKAKKVDGRSDIYQLGLLAFELLAGRRAFPQDEMKDLIHHVFKVGVPDLLNLAPETDEDLVEVIEKATEPDVEERFASAKELVKELSAVAPYPQLVNTEEGSRAASPKDGAANRASGGRHRGSASGGGGGAGAAELTGVACSAVGSQVEPSGPRIAIIVAISVSILLLIVLFLFVLT